MTLAELLSELNFILNNDDTQTHPAFSTTRLKKALNFAYRDEVRQAKLEANVDWFFSTREVTWPADQLTLALPADMRGRDIHWIHDVTEDDPGEPIVIGEANDWSYVHWKDAGTLQWGSDGPSSARTLRFGYYPSPSTLVEDDDEPIVLPDDYHDIIPLSAAVHLTEIADREAPGSWSRKLYELRMDLAKLTSKPRPGTKGNRIKGGPGGGTYLSDPYTASGATAGLEDVN